MYSLHWIRNCQKAARSVAFTSTASQSSENIYISIGHRMQTYSAPRPAMGNRATRSMSYLSSHIAVGNDDGRHSDRQSCRVSISTVSVVMALKAIC